jgi:hypothetical protein
MTEPYADITERRERRDEERYSRYNVPHISRMDWLEDFAKNYQPGQHATFLGPTGRGKTRTAGQALIMVQRYHPEIQAWVLHGKIKGRDETIVKLSKAAKLQMISGGKPTLIQRARHRMDKYRNGYIVRPLSKPGDSVESENEMLHNEFGKTIYHNYHSGKKHPVILVVDEAHQAHNDLKLKSACEGPLMRGRPVCAEWSLVQRGRFVSHMIYDQAEYVLIFYDPVKDNQDRYSEIGGVDPQFLKYLSKQLQTKTAPDGSTYSEFIFFRRSGDYLAIVGT